MRLMAGQSLFATSARAIKRWELVRVVTKATSLETEAVAAPAN